MVQNRTCPSLPGVEVYDAEMVGLSVASGAVIGESLANEAAGMRARRIFFFADNTGSIQTIFEEKAKSGQEWSRYFKRCALLHLDANPRNTIDIIWVPGHQDVEGNEKSDVLAKEATSMNAAKYKTITNARREARAIVLGEWKREWSATQGGSCAWADRFKPAFKPKKHFEKLPRALYALVLQVRTGHAFTGEYYSRFVPSEDTACGCGVNPQTHRHILQDCELFEEHRDILRDVSQDVKMADILGTAKGIDALASFIKRSGAFKKAR